MPAGIYKHNPLTEEHKKKISEGNKGKLRSKESRQKMRLKKLGIKPL